MSYMVDAHTHIHSDAGRAAEIIQRATKAGICRISVCATGEHDWDAVAELANAYPECVIPSFGIHPWWAAEASEGWVARLRARLEQFPQAGIGEAGLCKSAKGRRVPMDTQEHVCVEQIQLAKELGRPLSLHCVYRHGRMLELLKAHSVSIQDPPLLIHAYSGGPELVPLYLGVGAYMSFGGGITKETSERMVFRLTLRLLMETDSPDMLPAEDVLMAVSDVYKQVIAGEPRSEISNEPAFLTAVAYSLAQIRSTPLTEICSITTNNADKVFSEHHRGHSSVVATTKKPAVAVGRNKSGRVWKNTKQRFSKVVNVKSLKKTYEKHKQEREERARMKDYENELKEAAKVKREESKRRAEERKKQKEENERKGEVVQKITNTVKIKKMSKKQLRQLAKR